MRPTSSFARLLAIAFAVALAVSAAEPAPAQDLPREKTPTPPGETKPLPSGPRRKAPVSGSVYIGDSAPNFDLEASNGNHVQLSRLRGDWIVLVFADRWRPVAELDAARERLHGMGARVVGVCHEKQQTLLQAARRDSVRLLMLADPTGEVSAIYGLYDWTRGETQTGFFVLDRTGVVRLAVLGRIFPPEQIADLVEFLREGI